MASFRTRINMNGLGRSSDIRPHKASEYKFNVRFRMHVEASADYLYMRKTRQWGSRFGVQEPGTVNLYNYDFYTINSQVSWFAQDTFILDPQVASRVPAARRFGRKLQEYFGSMLDTNYTAPEAKAIDVGHRYFRSLFKILYHTTQEFKQMYKSSAGSFGDIMRASCDPVGASRIIVSLRVPFFAVMFKELGTSKLKANHAFSSSFNSSFGRILPFRINTNGFPEVWQGG